MCARVFDNVRDKGLLELLDWGGVGRDIRIIQTYNGSKLLAYT